MVSSVKRRWFTRGHPPPTQIPFKRPLACVGLHSPERTSLHKMKMYGDSGSPRRIPLLGLILSLGEPLMRKAYVTEVTQAMIKVIHRG